MITATSLPCEVYALRKNTLGSMDSPTAKAAVAVDYRDDAGERTGVRSYL